MGQEDEPKSATPAPAHQEMAASTTTKKKKACCTSCGHFMYNRETGEVMGRRPLDWCKLLAFYVIFWGFLAAYFTAFYELFYCQISDTLPRLVGENSLMKDSSRSTPTPGMGFMPMPDTSNSVIRFTSGSNNETYSEYLDDLENYMQRYTDTANYTAGKKCGDGDKATDDTFCLFDDIDKLGKCAPGNGFGFEDGHPCVMLRLNRMITWEPQPITCTSDKSCSGLSDDDVKFFAREGRPGVPLTQVFDGKSVVITCEGITPADRENINSIEWFPPTGRIPTKYFPYMNQKNYTSPFVMAKFHLTPGVLVLTRCRAWAQNIKNTNLLAREGAVHFELFVDIDGIPE